MRPGRGGRHPGRGGRSDRRAHAPSRSAPTILAEGWTAGTPVLPLLDAVRSRLDATTAVDHLHHGLTTQDVIDTSAMILARRAIAELSTWRRARAVRSRRPSSGSAAGPRRRARSCSPPSETTFGFRSGRWLAPLDRDCDAPKVRFPVQLGGLIGDRAGSEAEVVATPSLATRARHRALGVAHRSHRRSSALVSTRGPTSLGGPRRWRATSRCSPRSAR